MITEKQKDGFIYLEVITMFVCVCVYTRVFSGSLLLPSPSRVYGFVPDCSV